MAEWMWGGGVHGDKRSGRGNGMIGLLEAQKSLSFPAPEFSRADPPKHLISCLGDLEKKGCQDPSNAGGCVLKNGGFYLYSLKG